MEDIRCTQCGRLLGKKMVIRYGEIKCPKCGAINIIDRRPEPETKADLTSEQ